ncbi:uncharacterized protein zgc:113425 isoform X3 [Toxotes jaculatrix]|uniref:uncharacterized protein zgc:113425 isoform X3 n=1 Tax=Toxotes jaculatrix TaxID=941984 RepID=UPI001B3ACF1D|nr:uncharacterized protein zgc:113425 isoform X3 [Toxotes jaculatrix]XP_040903688.1 uncharacterized protein zgc:113425 isoform X3 [Toxotes jaculatrix]
MDRYRYFIFNQKGVLVLGILQVACAGLCVVCGFMDAVFRKDTPLSTTRTPVWGGLIMASPGVLALFASQRKNSVLVSVMVAAAGLSCAAALFISGYACLTLTYGEEDEDVFHHHDSPQVTCCSLCLASDVCASSDGEGGQRHHTADLHHRPGSLLPHCLCGLSQSALLWLLRCQNWTGDTGSSV